MRTRDGRILVTGASGLVGSNVCRLAHERGLAVRALVRDITEVAALAAPGLEVVQGDITVAEDVRKAAAGTSGVVHTAALIAGIWPSTTPEDNERVNLGGTINVLDAAEDAGVPAVVLSTSAILPRDKTLTEELDATEPMPNEIPYTGTKRRAYFETMARAERGQDVAVVFPGGVYGPSPCVNRALRGTSFNAEIVAAIEGRRPSFPPLQLPWVLGADVAEVALSALLKGERGARYLALGLPDNVMSIPDFLTLACEAAGVGHRVKATRSDDPKAVEEFGYMARVSQPVRPEPYFDRSWTARALGDRPTALPEGISLTIAWLRKQGRI